VKIFISLAAVIAMCAGVVVLKASGMGPFAAGLPVSLRAPTGLEQQFPAGGRLVPRGQWISRTSVRLSALAPAHETTDRLQVDVARNGAGFATDPQFTSAPTQKGDGLTVWLSHLKDGSYRWRARLYNGNAISRWVGYSPYTAFGVQTTSPAAPRVTSATDPLQSKIYRSPTVALTWTQPGWGISGYWYSFHPATSSLTAAPKVMTRQTSVTLHHVATGTFAFSVRARNRAGAWGPAGTYTVRTDTTPPTISNLSFSTFNFNPTFTPLVTTFNVDRAATVRIGFYGSAGHNVRMVVLHTTRPNQLVRYVWHGNNNSGQRVATGTYSMYVRATDALGNTSLRGYSGLSILDKRIVVSLSQQRLWAYDGNHLFITSLVTTGNKALPTPTGVFTILAKFHPFTFVSPAPKGAWDWYPNSPVSYAMLFQQRGYYIHDAPWRSVFGPGTNSQTGTPGQNYTGSHGCVNTPFNVAQALYYWAPDGTPVQVVN